MHIPNSHSLQPTDSRLVPLQSLHTPALNNPRINMVYRFGIPREKLSQLPHRGRMKTAGTQTE